MSTPKLPFQDFISVLQAMPIEQKNRLIHNYQEFGRLKNLCEVKKYIEVLPGMKGIKVLQKTAEVAELKKVIDFLKPGGFTWDGVDIIGKKQKKH